MDNHYWFEQIAIEWENGDIILLLNSINMKNKNLKFN